ncbi:MAG: hypothetical protein ACLUKO_11445 [Enterocloster bolteae]
MQCPGHFGTVSLGLLFYVVPAVLLAGAAVCGILYGRRLKAQNRRLAGRLGELAQADRELAAAGEYVKGMKVYLTEHFVISASYQFEVPYARLKQAEYSSGMVIGITEDGFAHILAAGRNADPWEPCWPARLTGGWEGAPVPRSLRPKTWRK